jgi:hypothetical protein
MQVKHDKTGIAGFFFILCLAFILLAFLPQKIYADTDTHEVSFTVDNASSDKASSTLIDKDANLYVVHTNTWTVIWPLDIEVQLPKDTSRIVSINSTYDDMNVDYDEVASITYQDDGLCTVDI